MTSGPVFSPGQPLPADKLQQLGSEMETYTPALTASSSDPTLGSGSTASGMWCQIGPLVHVWWSIEFGTSGVAVGSGTYQIGLPVTVDPGAMPDLAIGSGRVVDSSVATAAGTMLIGVEMASGDPNKARLPVEGGILVTHAAPWTWAASDRLFGHCVYPGDF